jgi:hypothetical protein
LTAAGGSSEGGQDESDEFEHRSRIVDEQSPQIVVRTFVVLQPAVLGVLSAAMLEAIEHPEPDMVTLLDEALARLEAGLPL